MSESQVVFQRDGKILVAPGQDQLEVAAVVRQCASLEAVVAGSFRFRISDVALWGAAARDHTADDVLGWLALHAGSRVPSTVAARIATSMSRYGVLRAETFDDGLTRLTSRDPGILVGLGIDARQTYTDAELARLRLDLAAQGWPVIDDRIVAFKSTQAIDWRAGVTLRPYQREAIDEMERARQGIVLLPCGAGKTVVGIGVAIRTGLPALILTPSIEIANQWRRTMLSMTDLQSEDVAIWQRGSLPAPVTIATYHGASRGSSRAALTSHRWQLVVYDEVQSLPANVFRLVSDIPALRRLGLTATLVREDRRETEVFAMVGPVVFDVPWVELERQGWIAPATCFEVRIPEAPTSRARQRYKAAVVKRLLALHQSEPTLVVGSNVPSLVGLARTFGIPLLTGKSDSTERDRLFGAFRDGSVDCLAVSRIGSVGLDLPGAKVMIQVSGNFGSRQEEAQRLGRLLRPDDQRRAHFYSLVSIGTNEERYARKRQQFLVDQGYEYEILDAADLPRA